MVKDTKMKDSKEETPKKEDEEKKADEDDQPKAPPIPPLQAAGRRLEKSLTDVQHYSNPTKVVRRWLGTSSGAAGAATLEDVSLAAAVLLDPEGPSAAGRTLLVSPEAAAAAAAVSSPSSMDVEGEEKPKEQENEGYLSTASSREVEAWLLSLSVRLLWKDQKYADALDQVQRSIHIVLDQHLADSSSSKNKSSLYPLLARLYRYRALVAEGLKNPEVTASLRKDMSLAHNMACLRRDVDSQATLLNLMLHDLLEHSQIEQAHKLLSNSTFPEAASNNQLCRYLYHSGRIHALRLEYTKAFSSLSQCLRKSPTNTGLGFRIAAQRLLVVVQLLMGEIPERHVFFTKGMQTELGPYLKITQAVRRGDLAVFTKVVSDNAPRLQQDGTYTLISRLAHQVVKAGLRKLHVSYSRLSLQDVADRLGLPSATSAEFVVMKAVRDGVLDATIYHEEGYVQSHDLVDVYATAEPAEAFHRRIAYCLTTHNDAVRGMRYPPDEYKKQLEASRGNNRRGKKGTDDKTDEEKAQELEDEFDEDY